MLEDLKREVMKLPFWGKLAPSEQAVILHGFEQAYDIGYREGFDSATDEIDLTP